MTLEQEGFQVRTYTDGESALQGLTARPVDLAVLDIKMPRMDGMELLQRLRQRSSMPVIFLTSKDEEVDELMGLRLGADDYITKPFSQRLLLERIRALLRRNEASRAEGSGAAPGGVMTRGDLVLDETKHQCIWKRPGHPADGDRVPAGEGAGRAARHGEKPRPADRRGLWREHLRRRPHHRQPRQAHPQEVPHRGRQTSTRSRRSTASATATRSTECPTAASARGLTPPRRTPAPAVPPALGVAAAAPHPAGQRAAAGAAGRGAAVSRPVPERAAGSRRSPRCANRPGSSPARWARARSARPTRTIRKLVPEVARPLLHRLTEPDARRPGQAVRAGRHDHRRFAACARDRAARSPPSRCRRRSITARSWRLIGWLYDQRAVAAAA